METALGDARRRAEDAASAKSAFLANMSHEIRTPMNGVLGFADLLLAGPLNKPQRRHAQLIADSGRAMMRLLNNILDVSKIEAGKMRLAEEPIDLAGHVRDTVLLMEAIAIGKDVDLKVTIDKALPGEVIGDAPRLRQVILNLVGNALKFTERGSVTVAVTAAAQGGERLIRFDVRDTGTGIAPGQLERIFEQFTQADDDRAVVRGGTGLGLAICAQLARLMGGRIEVESRPGEGSTFSFSLPAMD